MNIVLLSASDLSYESGSILYTLELFKYLHEKGHKAFLIGKTYPQNITNDLKPYIKIIPELLEHPIIDDREISDWEISRSLIKTFEAINDFHQKFTIDLIHAQYGSFTSYTAFMMKGLSEIPYIISSFGRDLNIGYPADKRIRWMLEHSFVDAKKIIVPEISLADTIKKIVPITATSNQLEVIPMPIIGFDTLQTFNYKNRSPKTIATINSCFSTEKGIDSIIRAMKKIPTSIPCILKIAGQDDHPDQIHYIRLKTLISELGLEKKVEFLGYLNRQQIKSLLCEAMVLVDARTHSNFSSVLIEAFFTGTPVIASNTLAARSIIKHGDNSMLFSVGDEDELASNISSLLSNEIFENKIRQSLFKWVQTYGKIYTPIDCFDKIFNIYSEIIHHD